MYSCNVYMGAYTVHVHTCIPVHVCTVHVHASCASGDCLTSRPKGRSRPRELWFSIYSCTVHVHVCIPCVVCTCTCTEQALLQILLIMKSNTGCSCIACYNSPHILFIVFCVGASKAPPMLYSLYSTVRCTEQC